MRTNRKDRKEAKRCLQLAATTYSGGSILKSHLGAQRRMSHFLHASRQRSPRPAEYLTFHCKQYRVQTLASSKMSSGLDASEKRQKMLQDYDSYRKQFQQVEDITATDLHHLLEEKESEVVLIDVRTPEEREVATLKQSVLSPEEFAEQKDSLKDKTVVTYCTAGLRSGKLAAKLQQEGFDVKNLKGSIIAWTQEGYPLVDSSGQPTKKVHTYGAHWAEQIGDGYESQTFSNSKGLLEGVRSVLPPWLGGTG